MSSEIFLADKYVAVTSDYLKVKYDLSEEVIDMVDVQSVKLSAERMKNWHKLMILFIALNVAMLIVILLAITVHGIWDWLRSFVILAVLLLNIYYSEVLRKSTRWTLTLETTSGPVDILTSPNGMYLSKVRRAINKALKVRGLVPTTA